MKRNGPLPTSPGFLLGLPRSGTTWMANILDAAPDTTLFIEPFSRIAADVFRPVPDTSLFLQAGTRELIDYFRTDFLEALSRGKTLRANSSSGPRRFRFERRLCQMLRLLARHLPIGVPPRCRVFELLNLNRMESDYPLVIKSATADNWIIKELRAAGKIKVLIDAFPESRFVVVMRHPCATVDSILKWFKRNRLGELRSELVTFSAALGSQDAGKPYVEEIEYCERTGHMASLVSLYWRVHYETLVNGLSSHERAMIIPYEALALEPEDTSKQILKFFRVPWSPTVQSYLDYSTHAETARESPTSTIRESRTYYRNWCNTIDQEVHTQVMHLVGGSSLMRYFGPFYSPTYL